ncbi:hypothetical protein GGF49_006013 [Coemansia sp. RSA 1853]|nr:hypothetical protein GGF49_006013 [Coemansia sp. RSA 1853]
MWARCWRQRHGDEELGIEVQLEIGRFVRTVANLPRPVDDEANEAPPNIAALKASQDQVVNNLSAAIDSGNNSEYQEAVQVFQIISEAYERANADYSSQLEAAVERVDRLLIREAELAATAATTTMAGVPTYRTLLEGLPPIRVSSSAEPSIHRGSVQRLSDADAICDPEVLPGSGHATLQGTSGRNNNLTLGGSRRVHRTPAAPGLGRMHGQLHSAKDYFARQGNYITFVSVQENA